NGRGEVCGEDWETAVRRQTAYRTRRAPPSATHMARPALVGVALSAGRTDGAGEPFAQRGEGAPRERRHPDTRHVSRNLGECFAPTSRALSWRTRCRRRSGRG